MTRAEIAAIIAERMLSSVDRAIRLTSGQLQADLKAATARRDQMALWLKGTPTFWEAKRFFASRVDQILSVIGTYPEADFRPVAQAPVADETALMDRHERVLAGIYHVRTRADLERAAAAHAHEFLAQWACLDNTGRYVAAARRAISQPA